MTPSTFKVEQVTFFSYHAYVAKILNQKLPTALALLAFLMFCKSVLFSYQTRDLQLMNVMLIVLRMAPAYTCMLLIAIIHSLNLFAMGLLVLSENEELVLETIFTTKNAKIIIN